MKIKIKINHKFILNNKYKKIQNKKKKYKLYKISIIELKDQLANNNKYKNKRYLKSS